MTTEKQSLCADSPWARHEGVTVVECPSCGFCFDADHEDMGGGYSCPNCQVTALFQALHRIEENSECSIGLGAASKHGKFCAYHVAREALNRV